MNNFGIRSVSETQLPELPPNKGWFPSGLIFAGSLFAAGVASGFTSLSTIHIGSLGFSTPVLFFTAGIIGATIWAVTGGFNRVKWGKDYKRLTEEQKLELRFCLFIEQNSQGVLNVDLLRSDSKIIRTKAWEALLADPRFPDRRYSVPARDMVSERAHVLIKAGFGKNENKTLKDLYEIVSDFTVYNQWLNGVKNTSVETQANPLMVRFDKTFSLLVEQLGVRESMVGVDFEAQLVELREDFITKLELVESLHDPQKQERMMAVLEKECIKLESTFERLVDNELKEESSNEVFSLVDSHLKAEENLKRKTIQLEG